MKIYNKLYVGFQKNRYNNTDEQRMLGFATYIEDNAAFQKRKETVDRWSDKTISPVIIENLPMEGFKVVDTANRYSTSNKLFRILDPRGFELEISTANMFDIIKKYTIVKGTIAEPMVWGRDSGNYLISGNSQEYKDHLKGPLSFKLERGIYLKHKVGNIIYRFEGIFFYHSISQDVEISGMNSYRREIKDYSKVKTEVHFTVDKNKNQKVYVYSEWHVDSDGSLNSRHVNEKILLRKSPLKDLVPISEDEVNKKIKKFKLPLGDIIGGGQYTGTEYKYFNNIEVNSTMNNYWGTGYCLFEDKKTANDAIYKVEDLKKIFPLRQGSHRDPIESFGRIEYTMEYKWNINENILRH